MDVEIIVAIIGAIGVIGAAIITAISSLLKNNEEVDGKNVKIKQKLKGKNNTQIAIQNSFVNEGEKNE